MLNLDSEQCNALYHILWKQSITGLALVAEDGRFLSVNPTFCRMLEYTESELRNKKFQDITDPDDLEADVEMARLVAAGEYETYDMTKAYYTKTKKHQPVLLRVTGMRMNGKFIFFVGEVAPLDRPQERAIGAVTTAAKRNIFIKTVKDYWVQIVFGAGLIASVLERVIDYKK